MLCVIKHGDVDIHYFKMLFSIFLFYVKLHYSQETSFFGQNYYNYVVDVAKEVRGLIRKLYITCHLWGEIKRKVAESTLIIQQWGIGLHTVVWIL